MIEKMDDPFEYEKPEWLILKEREHNRKLREKRLGRPIGTWGGARKGAGTKKRKDKPTYTDYTGLHLNNIQRQVLTEMGNGDLGKGIEALINQHI